MSEKKVIPIGGGGGGESIIVDDALSTSSTNPVQNKAITNALNNKANKSTTLAGYGITNAYTKTEVDASLSAKANNADLSTVAKTGQYSDIKGKPSALPANGGDSATVNGHTVESDVPANAKFTDTIYELPNATSSVLGGVKIGSNITVSSGTISLSKSNVTSALGYTPPTSDTTYSNASTSSAGLMSASDKTKLDGIASGANAYTLPTASSSTLGGVKTTSTVTSTSGLTACPIISGVPYYKDTNNTYTLSSFGVTATAAELNLLDGVTATTTELNYVDGVTSNIQTQLNGKLSTSGTAAKATADASGNTITSTYATKTELTNGLAGKLNTTGGNVTGHIYLTGAKESSSTGNTSQIIFGTADNNHVTISSNNNALVINPSASSTTNQIVLYLDKASVFPGGISGNASSASKLTTNAGSTTQPVYFSNGVPVKTTYTLGKSVPSDAVFTDTVYTLPNATSSILGGVKIGTNISVSSGTISVADASTSAKGVVQLSSAINSTSTSLAATASAVKSAYDLANGKQSPATTLAGYGITNAYTKTETKSNFLGWNRGAYDVDTLVNAGIYMIASGSNAPSGSQYGSLLTMPYRSLTGNSTPDFGTQIFIPNGDDETKPNSMFFRTSLSGSWNAWQEVATKSEFYTKEEVDSLVGKNLGMKATGDERTRASGKYNYGL